MTRTISLWLILILAGSVSLGLLTKAEASENVRGRYLSVAGNEISIELEAEEPVPALVIVIQHLPSAVMVIGAQPEPRIADAGKGQVKWLLSGLKGGKHRLVLKLDKPVTDREVRGEIRYRNPADGNMVTRAIGN